MIPRTIRTVFRLAVDTVTCWKGTELVAVGGGCVMGDSSDIGARDEELSVLLRGFKERMHHETGGAGFVGWQVGLSRCKPPLGVRAVGRVAWSKLRDVFWNSQR